MITEFRDILRRKFFARLEEKTGWGKEEIKRLFDEVCSDTLAKMIEARE